MKNIALYGILALLAVRGFFAITSLTFGVLSGLIFGAIVVTFLLMERDTHGKVNDEAESPIVSEKVVNGASEEAETSEMILDTICEVLELDGVELRLGSSRDGDCYRVKLMKQMPNGDWELDSVGESIYFDEALAFALDIDDVDEPEGMVH